VKNVAVSVTRSMYILDDDNDDEYCCSDVAETISDFYSKTTRIKPPTKTQLTNYDVDQYLHKLGQVTREQDQLELLRQITEKSTVNDLRMFIRLIQKDLVNKCHEHTRNHRSSIVFEN
jgi:aminoglycoside phosphotransferase family enzyme